MSNPASSISRSRTGWRSRLTSPWGWGVLLLIAALIGLAFWQGWFGSKAQEDLLLVTVQKGDLEDTVSASGTLQPKTYVDVGAQVSGQLKVIHVEVGSEVKQGQLLAEIDPTVYLAKVDGVRANLKAQRAQLLDRQAQLELAQLKLTRQKNLMQEDATSREALQIADATARSARAQLDQLKAQIEQTESTLRADEANLNYAKIYAPMAGTVVSISAREGQTLNASQQAPTLLRLADLSTMTVQTLVSEADVSRLRAGMPAYFTTLGNSSRRYFGKLVKVEPTPTLQNNVVLYNALFDVPNPRRALMTQMTAQVFFVVASVQDTLLIPMSAVKFEPRKRDGKRGPPSGSTSADAPTTDTPATASTPTGTPSTSPAERDPAVSRRGPDQARSPSTDATPGTPRAGRPEAATAAAADSSSSGRNRRHRERGAHPATSPETSPSGRAEEARPVQPRKATVKVLHEATGKVEDRVVEIGVTSRIQAQVLSGLNEGDKVVAGARSKGPGTNGAANTPGANRSGLQPRVGGMR